MTKALPGSPASDALMLISLRITASHTHDVYIITAPRLKTALSSPATLNSKLNSKPTSPPASNTEKERETERAGEEGEEEEQ